MSVASVNYREALSILVGKMIVAEGFVPGTCTGMVMELVQSDALGILWKDPDAKTKTYLFGLLKRKPQRKFLGTIWFSNQSRGATPTNWVFEVYGREHVEKLKLLAEKLAAAFDVKIDLNLVREVVETEVIFDDYDL